MAIQTDWVSPAQAITGRDHLAVQAVSEHLYAILLPGITNVTDRARCYTFYPWFVWTFDRIAKNKGTGELIRLFRRAECLHTLIGIYHELETGNEWAHGYRLVGRETLVAVARRLVERRTIRLSQFSSLDATTEDRYFKNKLGGLGQYYLGPLKELEVLDGDGVTGLRYTAEWGATLAKLYDANVAGPEFFEAVRRDQITLPVLRSLKTFCPYNLRESKQERDALIELLFCRGQDELKHEAGLERRNTLLLVLDYARRIRNIKGQAVEPQRFLSSAYSQFLPDGNPWVVDPVLQNAIQGWGIYQRHELLAIAVQGLFWAGLAALGAEGSCVPDAKSYTAWFGKHFESELGERSTRASFTTMVEGRRADQPAQANWKSANHELCLAEALLDAQAEKDPNRVVALSVQIIPSLLARGCPAPAYGRFEIADRFLDMYEINLASLQRFGTGAWAQMNGREWIEWLAGHWGLQAHFRVALRKLRHQTQDAFRIVPLDDGLHVREAPTARWSLPRLTQAFRFLYDLGAFDDARNAVPGSYVLNAFGDQLLEAELGRR